ncbi:polysaccharide biosynthesis/export family protein [Sphingomonas sp. RS6]
MSVPNLRRKPAAVSLVLLALLPSLVGGCSTLGASGPSSRAVMSAGDKHDSVIKVVDVTNDVAQRVLHDDQRAGFVETFGEGNPVATRIGKGDALDIAIWEAPPAALFGTMTVDAQLPGIAPTARNANLPQQIVDDAGTITLPFVGRLTAAGRTPNELANQITARLAGKAHEPQVVVRIVMNRTSNVTIVGDVATSSVIPLTPKGERLLDAVAESGGVKQPVGKTTIQIAREGRVVTMPLETIIRDPRQNIYLAPSDVITVLYQPYSFTALGAVTNNAEISFEGTGITLAQALGRIGGLQDSRANVRGVFIFRLERPSALDPAVAAHARTTPDGRVPVIYRIDLKNPASFFIAQGFPIHNQDVLYVSNAPGVDLQKFVSIVSQMAFSVIGISNAVN